MYNKKIIDDGPGYWRNLKNFDALLAVAGIRDDADTYEKIENIIKTTGQRHYKEAIANFLAGADVLSKKSANRAPAGIDELPRRFGALLSRF